MRTAAIAKFCVCLMLVVSAAATLGAQAAPAAPANETATQFYVRYLAAFQKATKIDQVLPMMSAAKNADFKTAPPEMRNGALEMLKMMAASNVKVTKETLNAKGAVLTVTGVDPMEKKPQYGLVTLVKEGGAWKLSEESWTNVAPK